jgi:hypothetical protein
VLRNGERFPVLPPVSSKAAATQHDFLDERHLQRRLDEAMQDVSTRKIEVMLMEFRKMDRDRDRSIHPVTLENVIRKYDVPVQGKFIAHL